MKRKVEISDKDIAKRLKETKFKEKTFYVLNSAPHKEMKKQDESTSYNKEEKTQNKDEIVIHGGESVVVY